MLLPARNALSPLAHRGIRDLLLVFIIIFLVFILILEFAVLVIPHLVRCPTSQSLFLPFAVFLA
jgi:hypothetical protein